MSYILLKSNFQALLEQTIARENQAPVGAFKTDAEYEKHHGMRIALDGCLNSFKIECQKIEDEENALPVTEVALTVMDVASNEIIEGEVITQ